jgi:hypothetical protein
MNTNILFLSATNTDNTKGFLCQMASTCSHREVYDLCPVSYCETIPPLWCEKCNTCTASVSSKYCCCIRPWFERPLRRTAKKPGRLLHKILGIGYSVQ